MSVNSLGEKEGQKNIPVRRNTICDGPTWEGKRPRHQRSCMGETWIQKGVTGKEARQGGRSFIKSTEDTKVRRQSAY